jgi:hypothetical protein
MTSYPIHESQTNVVFQINWMLFGKDDSSGLAGSTPAQTTVTYVAGEPFIPYSQLTQAEVQSWIISDTPADQMTMYQNQVAARISEQLVEQTLPVPWPSSPTT